MCIIFAGEHEVCIVFAGVYKQVCVVFSGVYEEVFFFLECMSR